MGTEGRALATKSLLATMRGVLDELDRQQHEVAAAYVAQAISMVERELETDSASSA